MNINVVGYGTFEVDVESKAIDLLKKLNLEALAIKVKDQILDLETSLQNVDELEFITKNSSEAIKIVRHSSSHILAQAVQRLFKDSKKAKGPATDWGFYYDFDVKDRLSKDDLLIIENEMNNIIKEKLDIKRDLISKKEAIEIFKKREEIYKLKILDNITDENVTIYTQGEYVDLCKGPHVSNTSFIKAFKLKDVSGAYWENNVKNKMLQRISGYAFLEVEDLNIHLKMLNELEKRDHRKLGRELSLFMMSDYSPGSIFFLNKGMIIRDILEDTIKNQLLEANYQKIKTPSILDSSLWKISGHWEHYKENMFITSAEDKDYAVKPMNCPGAMLVFKNELRSYKDLPLRLSELGNVCRKELSGSVHGLMRTREFTQDDAHVFVSENLIEEEVKNIIDLVDKFYSQIFDFKYYVELSTRPKNSIGSDDLWNKATEGLKKALNSKQIDYKLNEGDGAFYGPKIDFHIKDAIDRSWQCATIQLDFNLPEKFDLKYTGEDGKKHIPIVIHRAIYGSIERFIGILIEHYEGKLPLWISPIQACIMTISEKSVEYAEKVYNILKKNKIRVELDDSDERIGQKIKRTFSRKIPIHITIGEKEALENEITVKYGNTSRTMKLDNLIKEVIDNKFN